MLKSTQTSEFTEGVVINTILKTVLKKLQMDRKVEMKAYSMVKQMLIEHDKGQGYHSRSDKAILH